jgi:hypothetical protein
LFLIIWGVFSCMREQIISYLVDQMSKTLIAYEVNGTPEKRLFRLRSLAKQRYQYLTKEEKELILFNLNSKRLI